MAAAWRAALGEARVLVSGFGKWGGGLYDLSNGTPEALDDLPTSGLCVGGGRLSVTRYAARRDRDESG